MFLPTTPEELKILGWDALDVILVTGDTYIDSPFSGITLLGKQLVRAGYRVGIIAQPDVNSPDDITRLGEPRLFWGISAGAVDSMVANTTALGKPRKYDDYTPGGLNNRRPNRATIVYTNLVRRYFKQTVPVVLGGIEASLRRVTHYDFWSDSLRRSVLLDAKADYLVYGMADLTILELAGALRSGGDVTGLRGLCYLAHAVPEGYLELPAYEEVCADPDQFRRMFDTFYHNNDPISAKGLAQRYADRYVVQNPPARTLTTEEMDEVYALRFENAVHPFYAAQGEVRALETIRFAIPTHRGCYGECNFCAIAVHEGRRVSWRSQASIVAEAAEMGQHPGFKGIISDLSGPTANMYGYECRVKGLRGACQDKSCIYPEVCPLLGLTHQPHLELLRELRQLPDVRKVFIGSGIRHDLVMADGNFGEEYLQELVSEHVSGQLKLAPEHAVLQVLKRMRKPGTNSLLAFKRQFERVSERVGKEQYLTYYLIAAYPGCAEEDMLALRDFASQQLHTLPEQVQIFTPTPSTYASLMYYTEKDPFTGEALFVEKGLTEKMRQKAIITGWRPASRPGTGHEEGNEMNSFDDKNNQRGKPDRRGPRDHASRPYARHDGPSQEGSRGGNYTPGNNRPGRDYPRGGSNRYPAGPTQRDDSHRSSWSSRPRDENRPADGRERDHRPYRGESSTGPRDSSSGYARSGGPRRSYERYDGPRASDAQERPMKEERVVRDDNGGFFMNRRPEGWVDRKTTRSQSRPQGDRPRRYDSDRPRPTGDDRPRRYDSDRPRPAGDDRPRRYDSDRPRPAGDDRPRRYDSDRPRPAGDDRPRRFDSDRPRPAGDDRFKPRYEHSSQPRAEGQAAEPRQYDRRAPRPEGQPRQEGRYPREGSHPSYGAQRSSSDTRPNRTDQPRREGRPSSYSQSGKPGGYSERPARDGSGERTYRKPSNPPYGSRGREGGPTPGSLNRGTGQASSGKPYGRRSEGGGQRSGSGRAPGTYHKDRKPGENRHD